MTFIFYVLIWEALQTHRSTHSDVSIFSLFGGRLSRMLHVHHDLFTTVYSIAFSFHQNTNFSTSAHFFVCFCDALSLFFELPTQVGGSKHNDRQLMSTLSSVSGVDSVSCCFTDIAFSTAVTWCHTALQLSSLSGDLSLSCVHILLLTAALWLLYTTSGHTHLWLFYIKV